MSQGWTTPSGGIRKFEASVDQTARAAVSNLTSPRIR
jgi:hypothetical protein